jgi:hypothetical protein
MYKIAISGKANSGKDTVAKLFAKALKDINNGNWQNIHIVALADPIKEIIKIMFPKTKKNILYGPSKNRSEVIPGAFIDDCPLTYRMLLQDLGTRVGRGYKESIWLDVLDYRSEHARRYHTHMFIVTDVRFRNEFDHLKEKGYTMIRVKRNSQLSMDHSSETEQESIKDDEFNFVIDNDSSLNELEDKAMAILKSLPH